VTSTEINVLVIGAGVSGLTTAICLAESGFKVLVRARELPDATHSNAAGAMWGPDFADHERLWDWGLETLDVLNHLARLPKTGVSLLNGIEASRVETKVPEWLTKLDGYTECLPVDLPDGYTCGWRYTVPVADMPVYLRYLWSRLEAAQGQVEYGVVTSLETVAPDGAMVVNCSGFGARELADDKELIPIRGQVVVVENPGLKTFFGEHWHERTEHLTYFLPQGRHVVLGSTYQEWRTDTDNDAEAAAAIVRRCAAVEPALRHARVLSHRVGIRPSRNKVRVERVRVGNRHVVHNYGHGGSGFSLSWGCAREVVELVKAAR
jgi:D-amino-acid oxidase